MDTSIAAHSRGCDKSHGLFNIPARDFSTQAMDWNTRKANAFALKLLAPKRVLKYTIYTGKMRTVDDLVATFQLSPVAMVQRLKQVGVI